MRSRSVEKGRVREAVWERMEREGIARFPFPPKGRIPNFAGAREAAQRLFELPLLRDAKRIKVNPDSPQRPVREEALKRGITVYMPTPRLKAGFLRLDPARIPPGEIARAASLQHAKRWAEEVPLDALPELDCLVVGSVAVGRDGARCGKGEGYADLEYGILRSLGFGPVPVVTTVHPVQVVGGLVRAATDLPLAWIVTPDAVHRVDPEPVAPDGIDWSLVSDGDFDDMPVLRDLYELLGRNA
jgi:5-formyltetrahydrofolate cyclo-ligase